MATLWPSFSPKSQENCEGAPAHLSVSVSSALNVIDDEKLKLRLTATLTTATIRSNDLAPDGPGVIAESVRVALFLTRPTAGIACSGCLWIRAPIGFLLLSGKGFSASL